jgi:hypothetical protein
VHALTDRHDAPLLENHACVPLVRLHEQCAPQPHHTWNTENYQSFNSPAGNWVLPPRESRPAGRMNSPIKIYVNRVIHLSVTLHIALSEPPDVHTRMHPISDIQHAACRAWFSPLFVVDSRILPCRCRPSRVQSKSNPPTCWRIRLGLAMGCMHVSH